MSMKIPVKLEVSNATETVVNGELVDVAPHLASVATFVVHRNPFERRGWQVTNVESGRSNWKPFGGNKETAINMARESLKKITVRYMMNAYRKAGVA